MKLLEVKGTLQREAKRNKSNLSEQDIPKLWILTPTASTPLLSGFNTTLGVDSLPGVYYLGEYLRTAIVVIHQLPRTQETLWLRILGRGTVQKQAIDELAALPGNHPFREVTLELLYSLQQNLRINQNPEAEDRELIMRLAPLYQEDKARAIEEGLQRGLQQGEQRLVLRQLNRRFGEIDSALIERIQGLSVEQLESLAEALLDFTAIADLEAWLSAGK